MPQQFRLVSLAPPIAPIVLGLNNTAIYLGVTMAAVVGAATIDAVGASQLPYVAVALVSMALIVSERVARIIAAPAPSAPLIERNAVSTTDALEQDKA